MRLKQLIRNERGAVLVEFALIVPLFLLMFFAVLEFAFVLYNRHALASAVREGGRYASVLPSLAANDVRAQQRVVDAFTAMKVQESALAPSEVQVDPPTPANKYMITVTVPPGAYKYQPFTPIGNIVGFGDTWLVARATFRWEIASDVPAS